MPPLLAIEIAADADFPSAFSSDTARGIPCARRSINTTETDKKILVDLEENLVLPAWHDSGVDDK